jgi:hypothetical protein
MGEDGSECTEELGELESLFQSSLVEEVFLFKEISLARSEVELNSTEVCFHFEYGDAQMRSMLLVPASPAELASARYRRILFSIGMCVCPWFWMGWGCRRIHLGEKVTTGVISQEMVDFWQEVYDNVLLEFMFVHQRFEGGCGPVQITTTPGSMVERRLYISDRVMIKQSSDRRVLVPLGGGKDSLVAWHMSKCNGENPTLMYTADGFFEFQESWRLRYLKDHMGGAFFQMRHEFKDDNWLQFSKSYMKPCGHPWAALVCFDAVLLASLQGIGKVVLGFEKSADYGNNIHLHGLEVNHQYDKSSQFLKLASMYTEAHLTEGLELVSPLSGMWELEITRHFCEEPELAGFHSLFMSCNEPIGSTRWCCKCEKCCFIYLLLSSFLSPEKVWSIFGENLFEKESLMETFLTLLGFSSCQQKPFECVGTWQESAAAVELSSRNFTRFIRSKTPYVDASVEIKLPVVLASLCEYLDIEESTAPSEIVIEKWTNKTHHKSAN